MSQVKILIERLDARKTRAVIFEVGDEGKEIRDMIEARGHEIRECTKLSMVHRGLTTPEEFPAMWTNRVQANQSC